MQFADFLPVAYNHLLSEIGAMYWRTNGGGKPRLYYGDCRCLSTRPRTLSCSNTRIDLRTYPRSRCVYALQRSRCIWALKLLNLWTSLTLSLSKSLINDRSRTTSADISNHYVPIGKARVERVGQELTLLSWGSTMPLCETKPLLK